MFHLAHFARSVKTLKVDKLVSNKALTNEKKIQHELMLI